MRKILLAASVALSLGACANQANNRAVTGAALGGATGALSADWRLAGLAAHWRAALSARPVAPCLEQQRPRSASAIMTSGAAAFAITTDRTVFPTKTPA